MMRKPLSFALGLALLCLPSIAHAQPLPTVQNTQLLTALSSASTCPTAPAGYNGTGCVTLNVLGYSALSVQLIGTPFSGTVTFRVSNDGVTYTPLNMTPPNSSAQVTTATAAGIWAGSVSGYRYAQVAITTYTSGTITALLQASLYGGGSGGGGSGGSVTQGTSPWITTIQDSAGGDATDTVNHAVKITAPIGITTTTTISGTPAVQGNKTTNAAIPSTNNVGAMGCLYNAAAPTTTETFLGFLSCDLTGVVRASIVNAAVLGQGAASGANPVVQSYPTLVKGITASMTGTTSTQVLAAVASNYPYVTACSISNTHASVDTLVTFQDGSGGTTIWTTTAPHAWGGSNISFPVPLKVTTQGNGLYVADVTTGAAVIASCNGFASTVSY